MIRWLSGETLSLAKGDDDMSSGGDGRRDGRRGGRKRGRARGNGIRDG